MSEENEPTGQRTPPGEPKSPDQGETPAGSRPAGKHRGNTPRRAGKRPVLRFVLSLAILVGGFNAAFILWFSKGDQFAAYMNLNADATAVIIRILGDRVETAGTEIIGERYTLNLKRGCDALQAASFYMFAVLTSPVGLAFRRRLSAMLVGTALLLVINLVRLISLYYTGVFFPNWFDIMHIDVWQAVFIFLPIVFWLTWLFRALRRPAIRNASK